MTALNISAVRFIFQGQSHSRERQPFSDWLDVRLKGRRSCAFKVGAKMSPFPPPLASICAELAVNVRSHSLGLGWSFIFNIYALRLNQAVKFYLNLQWTGSSKNRLPRGKCDFKNTSNTIILPWVLLQLEYSILLIRTRYFLIDWKETIVFFSISKEDWYIHILPKNHTLTHILMPPLLFGALDLMVKSHGDSSTETF